MKTTFRFVTGACVASLLTASAAMAHHSFAMFDRSIEKVATGTVARWQFNAPHSWLYLNVKNARKALPSIPNVVFICSPSRPEASCCRSGRATVQGARERAWFPVRP